MNSVLDIDLETQVHAFSDTEFMKYLQEITNVLFNCKSSLQNVLIKDTEDDNKIRITCCFNRGDVLYNINVKRHCDINLEYMNYHTDVEQSPISSKIVGMMKHAIKITLRYTPLHFYYPITLNAYHVTDGIYHIVDDSGGKWFDYHNIKYNDVSTDDGRLYAIYVCGQDECLETMINFAPLDMWR